MKINDHNIAEFTGGSKFHNDAKIELTFEPGVHIRNNLIQEIIRGKNVLHVGCVDHVPLIQTKIEQKKYLHALLDDVCNVVGYDINQNGINFMKKIGFHDVYYSTKKLTDDHPYEFDYIVFSDVIEHLENPNSTLRELLNFSFKKMLVSTPNAMRLTNKIKLSERVNTDHVHWYSPYTLEATLARAGFTTEKRYYTDFKYKKNLFRMATQRYLPQVSDGLLYIVK